MTSTAEKIPLIRLNDGNLIPIIGFGTYSVDFNAIKLAIDAGYRHFDGADFYENEDQIGRALREAIKDGKVKREDLFITTKVWPNWFSKGRPTKSVERSLKNLGFDYVDLLLIHWPTPFKQVDDDFFPTDANGQCLADDSIQLSDVWKEFEQIKKAGLTRSIGVSNFNSEQIDDLIKNSSTVPAVNQVESHPYLSNAKLLKWCRERHIELTAYSPLARTGNAEEKNTTSLFELPLIRDLANKYGVSPAGICIKWQTQRGVIVIPKSATKERMISNTNIFHFNMTDEEMSAINALNKDVRIHPWNHLGIDQHKNWPFGASF